MNLVIFRLACCCGLRVSEIAQLQLDDVRGDCGKLYVVIRKSVGKGGRSRRVPLWWDAGTLEDVLAWKEQRVDEGAHAEDLVIRSAKQLSRQAVRKRFLTA